MSVIAKSVVFDFADDWGEPQMGIRSIEFKLSNVLIDVNVTVNAAAAATTDQGPGLLPMNAFDVSSSKTGAIENTTWIATSDTNQRLTIEFEFAQEFNEIVINNAHYRGMFTDWGVKNTKIYITSESYLGTVYDDTVPGGVLLKEYQVGKHSSTDGINDERVVFKWGLEDVSFLSKYDLTSTLSSPINEVFISPDGYTMYIHTYYNGATVYQYSLSTVFDVSTAVDTGKSFWFGNEDSEGEGFALSIDGTVMYNVTNTDDTINQYTLSTAWDVSTASYDSKTYSFTGTVNNPSCVFIKPDGLKMFIGNGDGGIIYQYTLSTAWDVSTASYDSKYADVANAEGVYFNITGTILFSAGASIIRQYILSTAWDVSTASSYTESYDCSADVGTVCGINMASNGNYLYAIGSTKQAVAYSLLTPTEVECPVLESVGTLSIAQIPKVPFVPFAVDNTFSIEGVFVLIGIVELVPFNTTGEFSVSGLSSGSTIIPFETFTTNNTLSIGDLPINVSLIPFIANNTLTCEYIFYVTLPLFTTTNTLSLADVISFESELQDIYYIFTLTGAGDGVDDVEIPILNFQCKMRNENPTFLQVTIPGIDYIDAINARTNGTLRVDMSFKQKDVCIQRDTIIEVDLEDITLYEGSKSASIVLIGYREETFESKALTLAPSNYRFIRNGKYRHRLSVPNPYIKPGDTVTISGDTFVANVISYYVSVQNKTMEISED